MDELAVRRQVRERYAASAGCGCDSESAACCGPDAAPSGTMDPLGSILRLGVGDPMTLLSPAPGETVLDLGSGRGRDVLFAAERVGPQGRAIGVDATPEMVYAAREAARSLGRENAEFRLGEIEHLPVESASVDAVASDCVINLSPDKAQVFREAFRVLKAGGRLVVSDVVADAEVPTAARSDASRWAACEAGAVTAEAYVSLLRGAGFEDAHAETQGTYKPGLSRAVVTATKPRSHFQRKEILQ